jgi:4-hydroxybenzoate polyprenyltransferase
LKALNFIINTNIFIAIAAVSLTLASQVQLGFQPHFHIYLAVIFFATLFDYNFHRYITVNNKPETSQLEKYVWAANHLELLKILMIISLTGLIACLFFVSIEIVYLLVPLAILTFLYSIPLFKKQEIRFRLKEIPGIKTILIALVWTAMTVVIPTLQSGHEFRFLPFILVFAERFTFIFAIAIPFDIRDMRADALAGIRTIPVASGEKRSLQICYFALLFSLILAIVHYSLFHMAFIVPAFAFSIASVYSLINTKNLRNMQFYYHGILDGCIILHGLMILLSYYFQA